MLSQEALKKAVAMEEETRDYYLRAKELSAQYTVKQFLGLIALEQVTLGTEELKSHRFAPSQQCHLLLCPTIAGPSNGSPEIGPV